MPSALTGTLCGGVGGSAVINGDWQLGREQVWDQGVSGPLLDMLSLRCLWTRVSGTKSGVPETKKSGTQVTVGMGGCHRQERDPPAGLVVPAFGQPWVRVVSGVMEAGGSGGGWGQRKCSPLARGCGRAREQGQSGDRRFAKGPRLHLELRVRLPGGQCFCPADQVQRAGAGGQRPEA